jgi:hypothetical protein
MCWLHHVSAGLRMPAADRISGLAERSPVEKCDDFFNVTGASMLTVRCRLQRWFLSRVINGSKCCHTNSATFTIVKYPPVIKLHSIQPNRMYSFIFRYSVLQCLVNRSYMFRSRVGSSSGDSDRSIISPK